MIRNKSLLMLAALWLPLSADAQSSEGAPLIQIRAMLHDPVNPAAELFVPEKSGTVEKLNLVAASLSETQTVRTINGSLVLYKSATADLKKPQEGVAATVKVPANLKRAIAIIIPAQAGQNPAYRMVLIDDSAAGFPKGESRVLSLLGVDTAIEAGEHKLPVSPGKITNVPAVKKVNEFNMAQTNFYFKEGTSWVAFTERQLQYLDDFRRIFIVHVTPGSTQPFVSTVVDTAVPAAPPQP
jgi:hypothetical protein